MRRGVKLKVKLKHKPYTKLAKNKRARISKFKRNKRKRIKRIKPWWSLKRILPRRKLFKRILHKRVRFKVYRKRVGTVKWRFEAWRDFIKRTRFLKMFKYVRVRYVRRNKYYNKLLRLRRKSNQRRKSKSKYRIFRLRLREVKKRYSKYKRLTRKRKNKKASFKRGRSRVFSGKYRIG